jgi:hypothetical protein
VRVSFDIDSNKSGREWTVKVYRNGNLVRTLHDTTGSKGNASFDTTFVADDDARVTVYAKAGYGEHCRSTLAARAGSSSTTSSFMGSIVTVGDGSPVPQEHPRAKSHPILIQPTGTVGPDLRVWWS